MAPFDSDTLDFDEIDKAEDLEDTITEDMFISEERIFKCLIDGKSIGETAKICDCSTSDVEDVWDKIKSRIR